MKPLAVASLVVFLFFGSAANAQIGNSASFGHNNTYSIFLGYSNDSSHIVLGIAPNRKLVTLGVQYERHLVSNRALVWRYAAEFRPLILVSDPLATDTFTTISPPPSTTLVAGPDATLQCNAGFLTASSTDPATGITVVYTLSTACSRRWTFAQGFSPVGTRINLMPHRRLQPTASLLLGYMLSAKKIPVDSAGSYNFTFEFGAGLEFYQSQSRSMRLEYQIQHFSNAGTGQTNPGVDNGMFKLTYSFGR